MPLPSKRDHAEIARRLTDWLAHRLPAGADPAIGDLAIPEGSGFSSETLLFAASWDEGGTRRTQRYVARLQPEMSDYPVFPSYDLKLQYDCLELVGRDTTVPVPHAPWLELDESWVGCPFFVMARVEGQVPADNPPYVFGDWLYEATPEQQEQTWRSSVDALAALHTLAPDRHDMAFLDRPQWGTTPLEQHLGYQRWYYDWARGDARYQIVDDLFAWLDEHRPADDGPTTITWGDARVGNIMYRDFRPVALFDWEMAALGSREVDLAWMLFMHQFWQDLANRFGAPGLPDFLPRSAAVAQYEAASGHTVRNLEFWEVFAALRFCIISIRTSIRAVAYGQMPQPDDPEDLIMLRGLAQTMLDGTYWKAQR